MQSLPAPENRVLLRPLPLFRPPPSSSTSGPNVCLRHNHRHCPRHWLRASCRCDNRVRHRHKHTTGRQTHTRVSVCVTRHKHEHTHSHSNHLAEKAFGGGGGCGNREGGEQKGCEVAGVGGGFAIAPTLTIGGKRRKRRRRRRRPGFIQPT